MDGLLKSLNQSLEVRFMFFLDVPLPRALAERSRKPVT